MAGIIDKIQFATQKIEAAIERVADIYKDYPEGGALHIVLGDDNVDVRSIEWCLCNSILEIEDLEERMRFVKCASALLGLASDMNREDIIHRAYERVNGGKQ